MSFNFTDFIVAGPAGQVTAGPAASFMVGGPGHAVTGEPGHVPIDTTPAHVPIDITMAHIPYSASPGMAYTSLTGPGLPPLDMGAGGSIGGGAGFASGGGSFGGGGGGGVGGGPDSAIRNTDGGGSTSMSSGGAVGALQGGGGVPTLNTGGIGLGNSGAPDTPTKTTGAGQVSSATGGGSTGAGGGSGQVAPTTGYAPIAQSSGGTVTPAAGNVQIAPLSGGGPLQPQGISVFLPTPTGITPVSPAGHVVAYRQTNPHGEIFGHTQGWPRDNFHHVINSQGFIPTRVPQAPWEQASVTFEQPDSIGVDLVKPNLPPQQFVYAPERNYDFDLGADQESNITIAYPSNVERVLDQSVDSTTINNMDAGPVTSLSEPESTRVVAYPQATTVTPVPTEGTTRLVSVTEDNSVHEQNSMRESNVDNSRDVQLVVNDTNVNQSDNSTTLANSTDIRYVDQDLTQNSQVVNNDTTLVENKETNYATNHVSNVSTDYSTDVNLDNSYTHVIEDNADTNFIDDREINFLTVDQGTNVFDNSRDISYEFLQAPERTNGALIIGNA